MALMIYDEGKNLFSGENLRLSVNGFTGGASEQKIYIRNDDLTRWFTNISLVVVSATYDGLGALGVSGVSFKLLDGERRPTEAEWDSVVSGDPYVLPNIGTNTAGDISTYYPVWIRIYIPGNTVATVIDNCSLSLTSLPRLVGA